MPGWIGPWEIAILLVIVLLVFGPKRLPEMGRSLGRGMREFKDSVTGKDDNKAETAELAAPPAAEGATPAVHAGVAAPKVEPKDSVRASSARDR